MTAVEPTTRVQRFRFASFDKEEAIDTPAVTKTVETQKTKIPADSVPADSTPISLPLPLPAYTEKDIQTARGEAQAQGYRDGYAAAMAKLNKEADTREDAIKSLLEVIASRITLAAESHARTMKVQQDVMGKLALAVGRKLAGDALKREPYAVAQSLLTECAALIAGETKVVVAASPAFASGLRQRIDTLKPMLTGFEGELVVVEDAALFDMDCRVEWKNGYGERKAESIWSDIEAIIAKASINS